MDAITLADKPTDLAPVAGPREEPGRLWQAPVFVLGLGAMVCFLFFQPYLNKHPNALVERALEEARRDLDNNKGDPATIASHLQLLLDRPNFPQSYEAEARFLYGTAHIRLAESTTGGLARDHWETARKQLEEAEKLNVPEGDKVRLQYRLGKAGYHTDADPESVVARLAAAVNSADDQVEGYNLLTEAYLRLTPPNLQAALDANEQLRKQIAPEEVLSRARLIGGEILLRMNRQEDARNVLKVVGTQAPPAILTKARVLRARSFQDESKWPEAATLWQAALTDAAALPEAGLIRYNLGLCYRRLDLPTQAEPFWDECVKKDSGDEKYAAAMGLAELRVQKGDGKETLELLELAMQTVRKPEDWNNKLLDRTKACELFERCCQTARDWNKFGLAVQLVVLYERIAPPGRALVLRGEITSGWAKSRLAMVPKDNPLEAQAVRELFKLAAEAYERAGLQEIAMPAQGEYLWHAVTHYIDAGEPAKAQELLNRLFKLEPRPDARLGEGWYMLGESFRKELRPGAADNDRKMTDAETAYRTCIKYETPFALWARYQLALFMIQRGDIDNAVVALEQNLGWPAEDNEVREVKDRSRFTLIHICYLRKNTEGYKTVVRRMEQVLDHLPATPEADKARYELADSYRLLADDLDRELHDGQTYRDAGQRGTLEGECKRLRSRAVEEFEHLVVTIEKPESAANLDDNAKRDVYYFAALTQFNSGKYELALSGYERMEKKYHGTPDQWTAAAGRVSAYTGIGNEAKVTEGLKEIRDGLTSMDPNTRQAMQKFIADVETSLKRRNKKL